MQLSVDGKVPKEFWILLALVFAGALNHETIMDVIL